MLKEMVRELSALVVTLIVGYYLMLDLYYPARWYPLGGPSGARVFTRYAIEVMRHRPRLRRSFKERLARGVYL